MENKISKRIQYPFYKTLILDVDGVIFDSNKIKESNIHKAVKTIKNLEVANEFTPYFINLSGIPREKKINSFFADQPDTARQILQYYNELNDQSLQNIKLTRNAESFIKTYYERFPIIALSGGALNEIKHLFDINNLTYYFKYIFGGPKTKEENIKGIKLEKPVLYIGDSIVDYEVSNKINADFLFMYGYTGLLNWKEFVKNNDQIEVIKNLQQLLK